MERGNTKPSVPGKVTTPAGGSKIPQVGTHTASGRKSTVYGTGSMPPATGPTK